MNHPDWRQLLEQGRHAVQARQGQQALLALLQANSLQPGSRDCRHWLGQAQRLCGQSEEAEETFRELLREQPLDAETAIALAFLLQEQGRMQELADVISQFSHQPAAATQSLLQMAGLLRDSNRFEEAIEVMQSVIQREGDQAVHWFRLARLYQGTGQHESALEAYREALRRDSSLGGAWLGLATLQRFTHTDQSDWQWLANEPAAAANPETAMCLAFARAKGFDDLQQYDQAWTHYQEGNRLRRLSQPWDAAAWRRQVQRTLTMRIPPPQQPPPGRHPVFIIGMLRAGTTLLEQLLDQHPQVRARGELNFLAHAWKLWQQAPASPALARDLAGQVWSHMRQDGAGEHRYIDKNPLNFRFLPLVAAILPEARILHLRRDGRDSCLSCFMQLFQHPDSAFANQLDDLVQFYGDYLTLMQHFEHHMPGQILALDYAELVDDSATVLQRVREFLGLAEPAPEAETPPIPPDQQRPIRTASSWQARQGIHRRSLERWRNYYAFAPDFFDRIAELDRQFRAANPD